MAHISCLGRKVERRVLCCFGNRLPQRLDLLFEIIPWNLMWQRATLSSNIAGKINLWRIDFRAWFWSVGAGWSRACLSLEELFDASPLHVFSRPVSLDFRLNVRVLFTASWHDESRRLRDWNRFLWRWPFLLFFQCKLFWGYKFGDISLSYRHRKFLQCPSSIKLYNF